MFSYLAENLNLGSLGQILAPVQSKEQQLHTAIEQNAITKVNHLLTTEKVDPMALHNDNTPIHTAAYSNNKEVIDILLGLGVKIDVAGRAQNTALHCAASKGHLDLVKYLVEKEANPAAKNGNGKTPHDVSENHLIRQFLMPLQFRNESKTDKAAAMSALPPG